MKMKELQVSEEYLDSLCEWMMEWVKKDDAYTVPQFLQWKGIGYHYFKYFLHRSPKVLNTFEVMKSVLCNRWLHLAMTRDELPAHRSKVLLRYLKLYDSHAVDMEQEAREQVAAIEKTVEATYISENYAREKLDGVYRDHYAQNVNKRRS